MTNKDWQSVIFDWASKISVVGILGWLGTALLSSFRKRINRGRALADEAKPELLPVGWWLLDWRGYVRVRNVGPGVAKGLRLKLSGCSRDAHGGEVRAGQEGRTAELSFEDQPISSTKLDGPLRLTIEYSDKYGNSYSTIVPIEQHMRADGRYNMQTLWDAYEIKEPHLSWVTLWKIGTL